MDISSVKKITSIVGSSNLSYSRYWVTQCALDNVSSYNINLISFMGCNDNDQVYDIIYHCISSAMNNVYIFPSKNMKLETIDRPICTNFSEVTITNSIKVIVNMCSMCKLEEYKQLMVKYHALICNDEMLLMFALKSILVHDKNTMMFEDFIKQKHSTICIETIIDDYACDKQDYEQSYIDNTLLYIINNVQNAKNDDELHYCNYYVEILLHHYKDRCDRISLLRYLLNNHSKHVNNKCLRILNEMLVNDEAKYEGKKQISLEYMFGIDCLLSKYKVMYHVYKDSAKKAYLYNKYGSLFQGHAI